MMIRLRTKLTAAFAATALICVLLIGLFSNIQLEKHFQQYVQQNQERKNQEIVSLIRASYQREGTWDVASVEDVGIYALEQGLIVTVRDNTGAVVWDAYSYNNGMCEAMTRHMSENMMAKYPQWQGQLVKKSFDLMSGTLKLGTIEISSYGPFYFNESDLMFIRALNGIFISVGAFSLVLAIALGAIFSKRISTPISRVIKTAQSISQGYYGDRSTEVSGTLEISQLTGTVNELAETLQNQENLRKRLTGDVAHELRTPLATLQSHLEAMIDGIWDPTPERLTSCHEEITRITRLVSDLEKLAHYESDALTLEIVEIPAADFLNKLLQAYEAAFVQKHVAAHVECGEDLILRGDRDKLSQVLINLIANALRFTPEGGSVTLRAECDGTECRIAVEDTGQGIAPEDLPHIFQRFYRADVSRNRATGGSGIGLSLAKAIVEAHGGRIDVRSAVGAGSCFTLRLPS